MANAVELLRAQYKQSFDWLHGTMDGVDDELAHYNPYGEAPSIAAQVVHIVSGIDGFILGHLAGAPLMMGEYADKTGVSEPHPEGDWSEWAKNVKVDLGVFHKYAVAVFEKTDAYLATLSEDDLDEQKPFGSFGDQPVSEFFNIMLLNTYCHTGEIAAIKGMKGQKGYPM